MNDRDRFNAIGIRWGNPCLDCGVAINVWPYPSHRDGCAHVARRDLLDPFTGQPLPILTATD